MSLSASRAMQLPATRKPKPKRKTDICKPGQSAGGVCAVGFSPQAKRYEALMDTLIQLRQPQLSRKPDETALSNALTEALPPLAPELLGDVAEALGQLEEEQAEHALTHLRGESAGHADAAGIGSAHAATRPAR
jgi:hypothetical protein